MGGTGWDSCSEIVVDANGNGLIGGNFSGSVDFGTGTLTAAGVNDTLLLRLDAAGTPLWSRRGGGSEIDQVYGLVVEPSGRITWSGTFQNTADFGNASLTAAGNADIFVVTLQPDGSQLDARSYGGIGDDVAYGVVRGAGGQLFLAGAFENTVPIRCPAFTSTGMTDIFVAEFGP